MRLARLIKSRRKKSLDQCRTVALPSLHVPSIVSSAAMVVYYALNCAMIVINLKYCRFHSTHTCLHSFAFHGFCLSPWGLFFHLFLFSFLTHPSIHLFLPHPLHFTPYTLLLSFSTPPEIDCPVFSLPVLPHWFMPFPFPYTSTLN